MLIYNNMVSLKDNHNDDKNTEKLLDVYKYMEREGGRF